jgi:hypothetical protein
MGDPGDHGKSHPGKDKTSYEELPSMRCLLKTMSFMGKVIRADTFSAASAPAGKESNKVKTIVKAIRENPEELNTRA